MMSVIVAGFVALILAIGLTPVLIRFFSVEGLGQEIREDGPRSHLRKRGTPTMGGLAIIAALVISYIATHMLSGLWGPHYGMTASGLLVLGLTVGMCVLGFLDDYIKLAKGRNLGLNKKGKIIGQTVLALGFAALCIQFPDERGLSPASRAISFARDISSLDFAVLGIAGTILFLLFILFLTAAWSNAVNLTDGLDGLASGCTAIVMTAYAGLTLWQYTHEAHYQVRDPLDLAIIASAALGATVGFLWWNAAPAKIFMGDTGSLALGGLVAGLSVVSHTELLMIIIGALFVAETVSVVLQVAVFKTTRKRLFRMAPFHHHFENGGWAETAVVVRFWLLTVIFSLAGVALFAMDWVSAYN